MVHSVVNVADFNSKLETTKLIVVAFFATWCDWCQRLAPKLEELERKYADWIVVLQVDADRCRLLFHHYDIRETCTFIFLKNKKIVRRFSNPDEESLESRIAFFTIHGSKPLLRIRIPERKTNPAEEPVKSVEELRKFLGLD